jgi:hypothetical protein
MKQSALLRQAVLLKCLLVLWQQASAQPGNCILKDPVVLIHFGRGNVEDVNTSPLPGYERTGGSCPYDGQYAFCSSTPGCFRGDWFVLNEDHTPGDQDGNFMLVNAYPGGGVFLKRVISGLKAQSIYELAFWLMNVCRSDRCCSSLSPDIFVLLTTRSGKAIAGFRIGELAQTTEPRWKKFRGFFTMPAKEKELVLIMQDNAIGGCGNDFALDDISFRECIPPPVVKAKPSPNPPAPKVVQQQPPAAKRVTPKQPTSDVPITKKGKPISVIKQDSILPAAPSLMQKSTPAPPLPSVLRTRANPVIKQFEVPAGEIRIDLYDNGEIDGDSVSVYHNNELMVSGARLSEKPVSFRLTVDKHNPHHELVMVADNLGSIPPNTSLMIITARDKRYQVFISSSEQKNAKVVFDLKE